ncbi:MAG: DUF3575 domain-containing protein [Sphingobacteriaceae bacterium]|nr:DUF3575 domain-containing protein [Sphingobacteriaceae bacterium]
MKLLLTLFCISLLPLGAYSQDQKVAISTNVLNFVVGGPSLAISYRQSPKWGFQLYGSYGRFNYLPSSETYNFKTGIIDLRYSLYEFLYVGPYLRYIEKEVKREGYIHPTGFFSIGSRDFRGKGISSGLVLGLVLPDSEWLNVEAFAGAGYGLFLSQKDYSGDDKRKDFYDVRIGLLFGLKL